MANPTTNYGFVLPTPTDLVTDLPADFDVALQGVDTRLKALQPGTTLGDLAYSSATANTNTRLPIGTTGQVLAVSGGVPAWTTTADVTPLTTKGDLFTFTTVDARIGVGANGTVLTADSAEATGLKWVTPAAGDTGPSFSAYRTTSTQSITAGTVTKVQLNAEDWDTASAYDPTTNYRFTPQVAGYYQVTCNGSVNYASADTILVYCYKNGALWKYVAAANRPSGGGTTTFGGGCQVYLNGTTDYIENYAYSFNATVSIPTGSTEWQFSASLIRTA